jgi:hypothetical protein
MFKENSGFEMIGIGSLKVVAKGVQVLKNYDLEFKSIF